MLLSAVLLMTTTASLSDLSPTASVGATGSSRLSVKSVGVSTRQDTANVTTKSSLAAQIAGVSTDRAIAGERKQVQSPRGLSPFAKKVAGSQMGARHDMLLTDAPSCWPRLHEVGAPCACTPYMAWRAMFSSGMSSELAKGSEPHATAGVRFGPLLVQASMVPIIARQIAYVRMARPIPFWDWGRLGF